MKAPPRTLPRLCAPVPENESRTTNHEPRITNHESRPTNDEEFVEHLLDALLVVRRRHTTGPPVDQAASVRRHAVAEVECPDLTVQVDVEGVERAPVATIGFDCCFTCQPEAERPVGDLDLANL